VPLFIKDVVSETLCGEDFFSLPSAIICYIIMTLFPLMVHLGPWYLVLLQWRIQRENHIDSAENWTIETKVHGNSL